MSQQSLFDKQSAPPSVMRRVSEQSLAAYDRETAAQQRGRVLRAIRLAGSHGITCDELAANWGVPPNAISGRFTELSGTVDDGPWIEKRTLDGKTITRRTRAGKGAAVWYEIQEDYGG